VQQELLPVPPSGSIAGQDATPVSMEQMVTRGAEQLNLSYSQPVLTGACPDCGSQLEYAEGCQKCHVCGYSECG
jgi:ribonucleoside-diphosphate reductase alpha chain